MIPFGPLEGARTWGSNVGIGITGVLSRARDSVTQRLETGFVVAARLAGGGNALRGFGEGQFTSSGARGWLANLGAELRVVEGAWLQFTAGYASSQPGDETTSRHWVTGFQVRGAPAIGGFFGLE
jgi:hypothetical protein